ncbi:hypothetical protein KGD83_02260 [Nocardiopsis akebiae]|uniref:Uncharacterized protein n=1 Tax=Nocardiopsis akebiae TaxID=2831968 RepID=A0ABX8C7M2_9ACTN|nr:hypothetical protein [Nocardiopsis akebiae]QUX29437.1 hypothetical protein KGD83_02260 [Nocardiopsis akebiae]
MSVYINSFLRKEDGTLVSIQSWEGPIRDPEYLEGALELTVNEVPLITPSMWDYIDELWAYILNSLEELTSEKSTHTYFPDQPIKLEMKRLAPGWIQVSISSRSGKFDNSTQVQENQFYQILIDKGEEFFLRMRELTPGGRDQYETEIEKCKALRADCSK